ncbi:MAG: phage holin family protein, partial [Clostridiales bacterium]|nr:phage holin family protein [Clostridiales bacterium]
AIGAFLAWLIGGFDSLVQILVIFIIIDYLTGLAKAWILKELSSQKGLRGIVKKLALLSLVVVAAKVDFLIGGNGFVRNTIIYSLVTNEIISILENAGHIGIPIPKQFFQVLDKLKSRAEEKEENNRA